MLGQELILKLCLSLYFLNDRASESVFLKSRRAIPRHAHHIKVDESAVLSQSTCMYLLFCLSTSRIASHNLWCHHVSYFMFYTVHDTVHAMTATSTHYIMMYAYRISTLRGAQPAKALLQCYNTLYYIILISNTIHQPIILKVTKCDTFTLVLLKKE